MSKSLKDAELLHTYQHDPIVISPVVESNDVAGQKYNKAGNKSCDELAKRVWQNLETSSTSKQKINDTSQGKGKKIAHQLPIIKPGDSKTLQQKRDKWSQG